MKTNKPNVNKKTSFQIKPIPNEEIIPTREYSNFVLVSHTPYDFSLKFCDMIPIQDIDKIKQNEGKHPIPVIAEIAVPASLVPNLIKALQSQLRQYRLEFKDIASEKKPSGK